MIGTQPSERPSGIDPARIVDFDIYNPPGGKDDFHTAWRMLHAPGIPNVVWTPHNGGHWIATRTAAIKRVLEDYASFSSRTIFVPKETAGKAYRGALPGTVDPPEHSAYRARLNDRLSMKFVRGFESTLRRLAAVLVEELRSKGSCNFTRDFAEIFPIQVLLVLTELPLSDVSMLRSWSNQMVRPDGSMTFAQATQNFYAYLQPWIDQRTGGDGDDLFSYFINAEFGNKKLTRDEALRFCFLFLFAGLDTVVNFLSYVMHFLASDAQKRRYLAEDPARVGGAVEEMFRRFPIVTIAREVTHDMIYEGAQLRQGDMIVAALPLVGLDEQKTDRPMQVDFKRTSVSHSTFGGGAHKCPGQHLARREVAVFIEEWLARIPEFEIQPGASIQFTAGIVAGVDSLPLRWDVSTTRSITDARG
jgi:camphor 5-monooxygenase